MAHDILKKLGLPEVSSGVHGRTWIEKPTGGELVSHDPSTGNAIGRVLQAGEQDQERVVSEAHETFLAWREVPAPVRGLAVRKFADAVRERKDELGALVSLEMGKILAEGKGVRSEIPWVVGLADSEVVRRNSEAPGTLSSAWSSLGVAFSSSGAICTALNTASPPSGFSRGG